MISYWGSAVVAGESSNDALALFTGTRSYHLSAALWAALPTAASSTVCPHFTFSSSHYTLFSFDSTSLISQLLPTVLLYTEVIQHSDQSVL